MINNNNSNNYPPNFQIYKSRLQELNAKSNSRALRTICVFSKNIFNVMTRTLKGAFLKQAFLNSEYNKYGEYKWRVHLNVEYMGNGQFSGLNFSFALGKTIDLLKTIGTSSKTLIVALEYALKIEKEKETEPTKVTASRIKNDIKNLQSGESLAIPAITGSHSMILLITCSYIDINGNKIYKAVLHNEGFGLAYHYYQHTENGKIKYQTAFEINDISEENLCGEESSFFEDSLKLSDYESDQIQDKYYEEVIPKLKGTIPPPSENPSLWSRGQLGGSCSTRCLLSLIRSQMSLKEYKDFKQISKLEMILKSYKQIKSVCGSSTIKTIITLEVIKNLKQSYEKEGYNLPSELMEMHEQIEKITRKKFAESKNELFNYLRPIQKEKTRFRNLGKARKKELTLNNIPITPRIDNNGFVISESFTDNLNIAFYILGISKSTDTVKTAQPYINKAIRIEEKELTVDEQTKLAQLSLHISRYFKDSTLSKEQIGSVTLVALLLDNFKERYKERLSKEEYEQIEQFFKTMKRRYIALNVNSYSSSQVIDDYIAKTSARPLVRIAGYKMKRIKQPNN